MENQNEKIICTECNTENETKYQFCKNCGTRLPVKEDIPEADPFTGYPRPENTGFTPPPPNPQNAFNQPTYGNTGSQAGYNPNPQPNMYNQNPYAQNAYVYGNTYVEAIDGIPYGDVSVFVGKKANHYMPVFSKMELTGSKINWHWPIAILGFFFGPFGAALWYFYRKMYKPAVICAIIGAVLTIVTSLITGPAIADFSAEDIYSYFTGDSALTGELIDESSWEYQLSDLINTVSGFATAIICGLFTHGWYKKHIHSAITRYRYTNVDPRYYQMGLASIGGTSGGMLALGIVIMLLSENIASFAAIIPNIIK